MFKRTAIINTSADIANGEQHQMYQRSPSAKRPMFSTEARFLKERHALRLCVAVVSYLKQLSRGPHRDI